MQLKQGDVFIWGYKMKFIFQIRMYAVWLVHTALLGSCTLTVKCWFYAANYFFSLPKAPVVLHHHIYNKKKRNVTGIMFKNTSKELPLTAIST